MDIKAYCNGKQVFIGTWGEFLDDNQYDPDIMALTDDILSTGQAEFDCISGLWEFIRADI